MISFDFGYFFLLLLLLLLLLLFKRQPPDGKTPWQRRTDKHQNCDQKLPNVTSETHRKGWFYLLFPLAAAAAPALATPSVQKTAPGWEKCVSKLRNGASATPKQQGPKGRTGPAGNGPNGLTLLSEPTRKVAVFELSKLRNGASATPKQQGPEGRTGPPDNGPNCLTLLSEITRKVAIF